MSDHAEVLDTSTGLDSRKLAIWTFIGSECMFFASLISNYLVHKEQWMSGPGPFPHEAWTDPATGKVLEPIIEVPLVTVGTALLLFSSLFIVLALYGAQRGRRGMMLGWLGATIVCGLFFVGMAGRSDPPPGGVKAFRTPSVGIGPGATAFTRIPSTAHSSARVRVSASTPALAAVACAIRGHPR